MRERPSSSVGGRERDDRPAALAAARAADEVLQRSDPAVKPVAAGIPHHLAGEIDLPRAVDRDHAVVARDAAGSFTQSLGMQFDVLVAIDETDRARLPITWLAMILPG
jgi:hypothetical protein